MLLTLIPTPPNGYQRLVRQLIECLFSKVLIPAFCFRYGTAGMRAQQRFSTFMN